MILIPNRLDGLSWENWSIVSDTGISFTKRDWNVTENGERLRHMQTAYKLLNISMDGEEREGSSNVNLRNAARFEIEVKGDEDPGILECIKYDLWMEKATNLIFPYIGRHYREWYRH